MREKGKERKSAGNPEIEAAPTSVKMFSIAGDTQVFLFAVCSLPLITFILLEFIESRKVSHNKECATLEAGDVEIKII
jgi:hypothetical protein